MSNENGAANNTPVSSRGRKLLLAGTVVVAVLYVVAGITVAVVNYQNRIAADKRVKQTRRQLG